MFAEQLRRLPNEHRQLHQVLGEELLDGRADSLQESQSSLLQEHTESVHQDQIGDFEAANHHLKYTLSGDSLGHEGFYLCLRQAHQLLAHSQGLLGEQGGFRVGEDRKGADSRVQSVLRKMGKRNGRVGHGID